MDRLAVDISDQWLQLFFEAHVVVRAAEPPLVAELVKRNPADRAGPLVEPGQLFGSLADGQLLRQCPGDGRRAARLTVALCQILPRVLFAQMQLSVLAAFQFRNVERGRTLALLALHSCTRNQAAQRKAGDRRPVQNERRKATGN